MKVTWLQQVTKKCWKVSSPKPLPMARVIREDDTPYVAEYNERPVNGQITVMERKWGEVGLVEAALYYMGFRTLEEIIRKKYGLEFTNLEEVSRINQ